MFLHPDIQAVWTRGWIIRPKEGKVKYIKTLHKRVLWLTGCRRLKLRPLILSRFLVVDSPLWTLENLYLLSLLKISDTIKWLKKHKMYKSPESVSMLGGTHNKYCISWMAVAMVTRYSSMMHIRGMTIGLGSGLPSVLVRRFMRVVRAKRR